MQTIWFAALTCYLLVMPILLINWMSFFVNDQELSTGERSLSWFILGIATLLWPVVLPLTYLELLARVRRYERRANLLGKSFVQLSER